MAYTAPPTKSPGDLLTSALWNTYIQGNAASGFARMLGDTTVAGSSVASINLSGIPATFAHLLVVVIARSTSGSTTFDDILLQYNGDTTASYDSNLGGATQTTMTVGHCAGGGTGADRFATSFFLVPNYKDSGAVNFQTTIGLTVVEYGTTWNVSVIGGMWAHTSIINSILLKSSSGNLDIGTRATIYGLPV